MRAVAAIASLCLACVLPSVAAAQPPTAEPVASIAAAAPTTTNQPIVALGLAIWTTSYLPSLLIGIFSSLAHLRCTGMDLLFEVPFGALPGGVAMAVCSPDTGAGYPMYGILFGAGQLVGVLVSVLGGTAFRRRAETPIGTWSLRGSGIAVEF